MSPRAAAARMGFRTSSGSSGRLPAMARPSASSRLGGELGTSPRLEGPAAGAPPWLRRFGDERLLVLLVLARVARGRRSFVVRRAEGFGSPLQDPLCVHNPRRVSNDRQTAVTVKLKAHVTPPFEVPHLPEGCCGGRWRCSGYSAAVGS
eukprot:2510902-Prymnesium_polylepis.1